MAKTPDGAADGSRIERILAYMAFGMVILSVLAFVAILLAPTFGVADISVGLWPAIFVFPGIALPIAFVLFFVVMIVNARRRMR